MTGIAAGIEEAVADLGTGYGKESTVAALRDGILKARLIMLTQLLRTAVARVPDDAEKGGLSTAFQILSDVQSSHPEVIDELLSAPNTGEWLMVALHRINTLDSAPEPGPPVWADFGYLGWLAAVGSIAAQAKGTMTVVVRNGMVLLPGIGLVKLSAAEYHGHCELSWKAHDRLRFTVGDWTVNVSRTEERPEWLPLRRLHANNEDRLQVQLDDLDPFRALNATPGIIDPFLGNIKNQEEAYAPRLTRAQAETWQRKFAEAIHLLHNEYPGYFQSMGNYLHSIVPLNAVPIVASSSHTAADGFGAVYSTAPADECQFALTLIHEFQHGKFNLLLDQAALVKPNNQCNLYAPWRDDPRPITGLMHGIYAHFGVTDFWRIHRHRECHRSVSAHTEFALWGMQVEAAIIEARNSGLLTDLGESFVETLAAGMDRWRAEHIPDEARRIATESAIAHRTFWCVRNRRPSSAGVAELVARIRAGIPAPARLPESELVDQQRIPHHHRRLPLMLHLKRSGQHSNPVVDIPGTLPGDRAYVSSDITSAAALYSEVLHKDPLYPQAWAGLALALPRLHPDIDFTILHEHGEIVAHLYEKLSENDSYHPEELIRWLLGS